MTIRGFKPIEITDSMVVATSLFDAPYNPWYSGNVYTIGAYVSVSSVGGYDFYKSLQNGNTGNSPASSPTWWEYSSSIYQTFVQGSGYADGVRVYDIATKSNWESLTENNNGVLDPVGSPPWYNIGTNASVLPPNYDFYATYNLNTYVVYTLVTAGGTFGQPDTIVSQLVFKSLQAGNSGNYPSFFSDTAYWSRQSDYPLPWNADLGYSAGRVVFTTDNKLWKTTTGCRGIVPSLTYTPTWVNLGLAGKYAPFDSETSTQAVANKSMEFTINAGICDAVALVGCEGGVATVTVRDGLGGTIVYQQSKGISGNIVADWWAFLYSDATFPLTKVLFEELPPYLNAHVTIKIESDSTVKLGTVDIGSMFNLGIGAQYGASIEVKDYSIKTTDEFGKSTFVRRGFKEILDIQVMVDKADFQRVYKTITDLRGTPWFIAVSDDIDWGEVLQLHGFYNSFRPVIEYPTASIYSLQFESLVTT